MPQMKLTQKQYQAVKNHPVHYRLGPARLLEKENLYELDYERVDERLLKEVLKGIEP